ncbi:MAG: YdiU family protein [Nitrospirae bacterium]|nr:YdiU family protein [Nitrospirota bacterium]
MTALRTLETLHFDNTFARLPEVFYAKVTPTPLKNPFLVSFNLDVAALIDLDPEEAKRPEFAGCFGGQYLLPGSEPLATVYAGHQFGAYVSRLGDGRAILLGEVRNSRGEKWDLHLKGAGLTPFSRDDDGRAVLRSCIREYLCSEAMHGLGIPTTRALCVVGSEEAVLREQVESGAMLLRLAPSHVRFGHFEFFYWRRQLDHIKTLADYVLAQHFPELVGLQDAYVRLYHDVAFRTARLIAKWQAVGFAHGVMNSDNMSVLGMTLDYGPFGFLDDYNPAFICNHSDHHGRYTFQNQPDIGYFNLRCLAQALTPLVPDEAIKAGLDAYEAVFAEHSAELMRTKLGLRESRPEDDVLIRDLLELMRGSCADYTNVFRSLCDFKQAPEARSEAQRDYFVDQEAFDAWAARYKERLRREGSRDEERAARMKQVNPKYVLRNYLAHTAIRLVTEQKDFSEIDRLRRLLRDPFADQPEMDRYAAPPPDWGKRLIVSCSS